MPYPTEDHVVAHKAQAAFSTSEAELPMIVAKISDRFIKLTPTMIEAKLGNTFSGQDPSS